MQLLLYLLSCLYQLNPWVFPLSLFQISPPSHCRRVKEWLCGVLTACIAIVSGSKVSWGRTTSIHTSSAFSMCVPSPASAAAHCAALVCVANRYKPRSRKTDWQLLKSCSGNLLCEAVLLWAASLQLYVYIIPSAGKRSDQEEIKRKKKNQHFYWVFFTALFLVFS